MALRQVNFKFEPDVLEHLDEMAAVAGTTRTGFMMGLICREWDAYQGNPQMKAMISKLDDLKSQMMDLMPELASLDLEAACKKK